jgi:tRNA-Thr(GGU) m(6)t(6)A37 methyltransferase TsaA
LLSGCAGIVSCAISRVFAGGAVEAKTMQAKKTTESFELHPVGKVRKKGKVVQLQITDKYTDALKGLDGYSHVFVLYWFDRNDTPKKRSILQVYPQGNRKNPRTGVFACRAPVRPNLIALSLCKILSIEGGTVRIEKIDALDGSPILDLKPYIPSIDSVKSGVHLPAWLKKK